MIETLNARFRHPVVFLIIAVFVAAVLRHVLHVYGWISREENRRADGVAFGCIVLTKCYGNQAEALSGGITLCQSGLTSAPRLPQARQTNRASISDSLTSSGQPSPLIAIEWLQR